MARLTFEIILSFHPGETMIPWFHVLELAWVDRILAGASLRTGRIRPYRALAETLVIPKTPICRSSMHSRSVPSCSFG